jgi:hypothetical protein
MSNSYQPGTASRTRGADAIDQASVFLRQVFITMALGLTITAGAAWYVAQSEALLQFFYTGAMKWIVMFAPLVFVFIMAARIHRMSFTAASLTFAAYSIINGISLAFIFVVFELGSVFKVFMITAGTFGAMAVIGLTTRINLAKFSSIFMMALVGLIIASLVNFFLGSSTFDYIISCVGVLLFAGLTAYDTQKMLVIGQSADPESDSTRKMALMGALTLYLDFINLFLFLLRLFGSRD